jgi:hypothetical protein
MSFGLIPNILFTLGHTISTSSNPTLNPIIGKFSLLLGLLLQLFFLNLHYYFIIIFYALPMGDIFIVGYKSILDGWKLDYGYGKNAPKIY